MFAPLILSRYSSLFTTAEEASPKSSNPMTNDLQADLFKTAIQCSCLGCSTASKVDGKGIFVEKTRHGSTYEAGEGGEAGEGA